MTDPFETARNVSAGMPGHSMSADVGVREAQIPAGMKTWAGGDAAPADVGEAAAVMHADGTLGLANKRSILWGRPTPQPMREWTGEIGPPIQSRWIVAYEPALNAPTESVKAPEGVTDLRATVAKVINEMSRQMPNATEDWRAQLTEALA